MVIGLGKWELFLRHNGFFGSLVPKPCPIALTALLGVSTLTSSTRTTTFGPSMGINPMPWRLHLVGQTCKVLWNDLNRFLVQDGGCRSSRVHCTQEPSNQFQRIHNWKNELQALRLEKFQFTFNQRNYKVCKRVPHRIQVSSSHKPSDAVHTVRCLRKNPRTEHRCDSILLINLVSQDLSSTQSCAIQLRMQVVHRNHIP